MTPALASSRRRSKPAGEFIPAGHFECAFNKHHARMRDIEGPLTRLRRKTCMLIDRALPLQHAQRLINISHLSTVLNVEHAMVLAILIGLRRVRVLDFVLIDDESLGQFALVVNAACFPSIRGDLSATCRLAWSHATEGPIT